MRVERELDAHIDPVGEGLKAFIGVPVGRHACTVGLANIGICLAVFGEEPLKTIAEHDVVRRRVES